MLQNKIPLCLKVNGIPLGKFEVKRFVSYYTYTPKTELDECQLK